jgi:hypothetical protein
MKFRAVSDGPQSALVVDVQNPDDPVEVRRAVDQAIGKGLFAPGSAFQREIAAMRRYRMLKPGKPLALAQAVMLRQNGRLVLSDRSSLLSATRAVPAGGGEITRAANALSFNIPTTGTGAWSAADAASITALVQLLYPELVNNVLGPPGWSGKVSILNLDPRLGFGDEVIGALVIINGSDVEIDFPTFSDYETQFLAMAQALAQTFHGTMRMAYDSWEQGMARAAAVVAARDLQPVINAAGNSVDPSNGFYYTPNYDVLNQPALGNNTFTPPTPSDASFNPNTLSGMLVPRIEMASTAWLKCFIENPSFFKTFNSAYYAAYAANSGVANDTSQLRGLAASADPTVELLQFDDWYERQYALDTSISTGTKLYAYAGPTFPSSTTSGDSGAQVFVVYYNTTSTGDELPLSGESFIVYWDYTLDTQLYLPTFESVEVSNGFGTVAPYFTNIGSAMRVAMDFPINRDYLRIYFPALETGSETTPNSFSGVVVGSDTGALSVTFEGGGGPISAGVADGSFGAAGSSGAVPTGFSRTTLAYTPTGGTPTTFRRNLYVRPDTSSLNGVAPLFVLSTPDNIQTLSHPFPAGLQMISLPVQPLSTDLASVLGVSSATLLAAQWEQSSSANDKYLLYPTLPRAQPGYALWVSLPAAVTASSITGVRTDNQKSITIGAEYGWNQIATPYAVNADLATDVTVQYLGDTPVSFSQAVANGWISTGVIAYTPASGYEDITNAATTDVPTNTLEAWKGYWIRVLVTEGITLTFANPNNRAAPRTRTVSASPAAADWSVPLRLSDGAGNSSAATFGQSARTTSAFTGTLDVASPPAPARAIPMTLQFSEPTWSTGISTGGAFLADYKQSGVRGDWSLSVTVPPGVHTYTLSWTGAATLPKGTRLSITDTATGTQTVMNSSSSIAFTTGKAETTRAFQITALPRSANRLVVTSVVAIPAMVNGRAARTVSISYEVSEAAQASIAILRSGRIVRHLVQGRAVEVGTNQAVWDTRDDAGRSLPAGVYSVQVTANSTEGDVSRTIVPLILAR